MPRFSLCSLPLFLMYCTEGALFSAETLTSSSEPCPLSKKHYRTSIRHIEGGGIGYNQGYTTLEAFLAPDPNRWIVTPFLDGRGHIFDNGKWAANAGVGLRAVGGKRVYGINTYYDYRSTSRLNFNQIGVGLETLGPLLDFRINGYFPFGKKVSSPWGAQFSRFSGHSLLISQKYQFALKGANAEVGFHWGKTKHFDFYAAAGPYYYKGYLGSPIWGGKATISGMYKDMIALEFTDSYDRTFHNKFQGQLSLNFSFGPKSKVKRKGNSCALAEALTHRIVQPVERQEIIAIDKKRKNSAAINPATGLPYFFVFVDNTSSSNGTYESPYHTFAQVEANSAPNDIIYVFPGNGTTTGMDSGILLKAYQKLWGSGVSHSLPTSKGVISIPAQSSSSPTLTNTNIDTEGNAITLATNNAINGINITASLNDALYGTGLQSLEVSSCTITTTTTYAIEASFSGDASISLTNNQFLDNTNGIYLTLNGTSSVVCSDNTFEGQTSVSSVPLEIAATSNVLDVQIENNIFKDNTTGSIRFNLTTVVDANINILNNTMTNNGTGSQSSLGSNFVILPTGTTNNCSLVLRDNSFSNNTSYSLYLHDSGEFTALNVTASTNTMSDNGGSALVLATPVDTLTLLATDNIITGCNDNGIAVISSGLTSTGTITINNNTLTDIGNSSNGIAVNQDFSTLNLTILNNEINRCEGTGIISYAPSGIDSFTLNISGNTISHCENDSTNAASGLDIEQFTTLVGSVTNNTLSDNTGVAVMIGSTLSSPNVCLTLTGNNSSTDYLLTNPSDGLFKLSPCTVDAVNVGIINTYGEIIPVQSCPAGTACPSRSK